MKNAWFGLKVGMAGVLVGLGACHPGDVTSISQLDLVVTVRDSTTDFTTLQTYFLLDSVVHIGEDTLTANDSLLNRDNDAALLALVRSNIEAMGYTESAINPDAIFMVGALARVNTNVYYSYPWYPYWGYYPGWGCCGPGYGWGYPGYGGSVTAVSYATGTGLILMADPNNVDPVEEEVPLFWMAGLNGLLEGSAISSRYTALVNQAFAQSPYLRTN